MIFLTGFGHHRDGKIDVRIGMAFLVMVVIGVASKHVHMCRHGHARLRRTAYMHVHADHTCHHQRDDRDP